MRRLRNARIARLVVSFTAACAVLGYSGAAASTTHDLRGTWSCCGAGGAAAQTWTITSMDLASGSLSGNGVGGSFTFPISGVASGDALASLVTGPYTQLPSYTATFSGAISPNANTMTGQWSDNGGKSGTWTATRTSGPGAESLPVTNATPPTAADGEVVLS